ncbi:MAG TPA: adenylyltransferase/cytidyltransferase family protein [Candidatus Andersenbacteria bacterium]|nr:adenylyltransferase/cytidyltransferase family protein [Candidatus Andersenbacteria bacterium]
MKNVVVFGTFDPLHAGHEYLFSEAKKLGDCLIVVVARDAAIRSQKNREPHVLEEKRLQAVSQVASVDKTVLGDSDPSEYSLLKELSFDCIALGYDQSPSDEEVKKILHAIGKDSAEIARLPAYKPDQYKSSLIRAA